MNHKWKIQNIVAELNRIIHRIEGLPSRSEFTEALSHVENAQHLLRLGEARPPVSHPDLFNGPPSDKTLITNDENYSVLSK